LLIEFIANLKNGLLGARKIRHNKNSCWCGWDSLPPSFLLLVKEQVASLSFLGG